MPGTEGDGIIVIVLALIAAAALLSVLVRGSSKLGEQWAPPAIGILCIVIAIIDIGNVSSSETEWLGQSIGASPGWGLWLTLVGGVVLTVAGGLAVKQLKSGLSRRSG
ncbi:hypothetical protein G4H71_01455 [Rhodococcus triatomae]|uniref:hypothetical protein n=1 Tax=Rhodococcus triatomae TaxID=300028 RepID=UPI001474B708|nr:hypothetical protein [Rhodococcus triatomae]QNG17331.1 hypothetical protein G4H72_06595 [Rhodococcus triatomae]QNG21647.1 hypothetical protein G4H71_01455 [Rhodococcus triatomae]